MLSLTRPARLWHNSAHPNQVNFRDWSRSLPFCFYPAPPATLYTAMRTIPILIHPIGSAARLDNLLMTIIVTGHLPHH